MAIRSLPNGATISAPTPFPPPLRRCEDCALDLGDVAQALICPRFGQPRHGVESRCEQFRAKTVTLGPRHTGQPALIEALSAALNAVDVAKRGCHPTMRETLDALTERARTTFAAVRS